MKIANINREIIYNFWTTWRILMKFSGKMWLMIIISHKKRGFHPLFRRYIFRKTTFPSAVLGLSKFSCDVIIWSWFFLITWYRASLNIKREAWFLIGVYLNNHIWLSILAIESLIFRQTFFPWNVSVNFRLNKCHSHTKMPDYFGSYLLALIKKLFIFRTYPWLP